MHSALIELLSSFRVLAIWPAWLSAGEARVHPSTERATAKRSGAIASIPVKGVILPKRHWAEAYGLATSVETLSELIRAAVADNDTKAVVLDVDSPGGSVAGVSELANEIMGLRGSKPIVAHADYLAASAAYHIAAATDEIVASPSALVGSVGVYMMHVDQSKWLDELGLKITYVNAGEDKVLGNQMEPLSDEGEAYFQGLVDHAYHAMVGDIAKARGVERTKVVADYGQGRILTASQAMKAGVIDKVRTMEQTLSAYGVGQNATGHAMMARMYRRRLSLLEESVS